MTPLKMKSREQRLIEAALEIVFLEPKAETKVSLPVRNTLYGVLKQPDGPVMLTVEVDETLDVFILPEGYTTSVGRVTFARMDFELNSLGNRRHYNETLEVDPKGRTWAYRSKSNIELSFASLADDALCDANVALKNQFWLKDEEWRLHSDSEETAANFAREIIRHHSGRLALSGPETAYRAVGSPVYEFFVSDKYVEALCHDYDTDLIPHLEIVRFYPDEWVRNCLTLPLYEFGGVTKLIEAMSDSEIRTVCNHHDFVSVEARALLLKESDISDNAYKFLETGLMELVGKIEQYEGICDDPARADVVKTIKSWAGFSPIHHRAAVSLHHYVTKLKAFVEADFAEEFEFTLIRAKWGLKISPLDVILIRLGEIIKLFNDIEARAAGWNEA